CHLYLLVVVAVSRLYSIEPPSPHTSTLSLHDALPIFDAGGGRTDSDVLARWRREPRRPATMVLPPTSGRHLRRRHGRDAPGLSRSEEHTSELQSRVDLVCRLLLAKKKEMLQSARERRK